MLVNLKASPVAGLQARIHLTVRAIMMTAVPCAGQMQAPSWSVRAVLASIIYTVLACKKSPKMTGIVQCVKMPDLLLLMTISRVCPSIKMIFHPEAIAHLFRKALLSAQPYTQISLSAASGGLARCSRAWFRASRSHGQGPRRSWQGASRAWPWR